VDKQLASLGSRQLADRSPLRAVRLDFLLESELRVVDVTTPPGLRSAGDGLLREVRLFVNDQMAGKLVGWRGSRSCRRRRRSCSAVD